MFDESNEYGGCKKEFEFNLRKEISLVVRKNDEYCQAKDVN